jgi:hypothetical protein
MKKPFIQTDRYRLLIICSLMMIVPISYAQESRKYSNEFLTLGAGGKAMGMGNVSVAMPGDVYSGYWNPAGLVDITDDLQAAFMHSEYFAGIANYDFLSASFKGGKNTVLGASVVRMGVDGILNTFDLIRNGQINYDRVTQFSSIDYGFLFHFAQGIESKNVTSYKAFQDATLSYGLNAKIIHRTVGPFASARGFGIDGGVRITGINGGWSFGLMAHDLTSTFNAWNFTFTDEEKAVLLQTNNEIPINSLEITRPSFVIGMAKVFETKGERWRFTTALDMLTTTDGKRNTLLRSNLLSVDPRIGAEISYKLDDSQTEAHLRLGMDRFQQESRTVGDTYYSVRPTIGVGIKLFGRLVIDYALSDIGDQSAGLYSNIISIRFSINK